MSKGFSPSSPLKALPLNPLEASTLTQRLQDCFASIKDPRVERTRLHQLSDILTIAILSVIAGGKGWEDMELYGSSKEAWLSTFLALPNGIPSADTFRRVFERIDPLAFERCFETWVRQLVGELGIEAIAIDGKNLKGSYDRASKTPSLHLVSAWATNHRLVLAQTKVADKSNEITAIPTLLELLDISGCIVTLDAMGTQKSIARRIREAGGDYILSLKANHPTLLEQISSWFEMARKGGILPPSLEQSTESAHHRIECRQVWTIPIHEFPELYQAEQWAGLQTIVVVERERRSWNRASHEIQFYLGSLPSAHPRIAEAIRGHWGIENSLHWTLDVTFSEDACRVRCLHAPQNLAILRRFALNALERESSCRRSLAQKSKRAAMSDSYMLSILAASFPLLDPEPSCQ